MPVFAVVLLITCWSFVIAENFVPWMHLCGVADRVSSASHRDDERTQKMENERMRILVRNRTSVGSGSPKLDGMRPPFSLASLAHRKGNRDHCSSSSTTTSISISTTAAPLWQPQSSSTTTTNTTTNNNNANNNNTHTTNNNNNDHMSTGCAPVCQQVVLLFTSDERQTETRSFRRFSIVGERFSQAHSVWVRISKASCSGKIVRTSARSNVG